MAADESLLEFVDEKTMSSFVKLQAQIRGVLIRKALHDIQKDYEEIVADIEEGMMVQWPSKSVGLPVLKKRTNGKCTVVSHNTNKKQGPGNHRVNSSQAERLRDLPISTHSSFFPSHHNHCQVSHHDDQSPCPEFSSGLQTQLTENINSLNHHSDASVITEIQSGKTDKQSLSHLAVDRLSLDEPAYVSKEVQAGGLSEHPENESMPIAVEKPAEAFTFQQAMKVSKTKPSMDPGSPSSSYGRPVTEENRGDSEVNSLDNEQEDHLPVFVEMSPSSSGDKTEKKDLLFDKYDNNAQYAKNENKAVMRSNESDCQDPDGQDRESRHSEDIVRNATVPHGETNATQRNGGDSNTAQFDLPGDKQELLKLKSTLAMELLWIQQAIISRKNYLKLRQQLA